MALSELTSFSITAAIVEFDELGRETFLAHYGFGRARHYFISVDDRFYDSKAIAGAAHGNISPSHRPLTSNEFSGGERAVADILRRLGFEVVTRAGDESGSAEPFSRNPSWLRDELILALDLYLARRLSPPGKTSQAVTDLSKILNELNTALGRQGDGVFRNTNGVYMKMMNFRRFDPEVTSSGRIGLIRGNKDEAVVWAEFAHAPERLSEVASAIRAAVSHMDGNGIALPDDQEFVEAPEGRLLTALHTRRERSRRIVEKRKERALQATGTLRCEACSFDFRERYGERGDGFIEVHHLRPVHTLTEGDKTRLEDLALVCANCHRMIHRARPWLSVEELRKLAGTGRDTKLT